MPQRKKITLITASILLLIAASFLVRGWIRGNIVPVYTTVFYNPSVTKNFDKDFSLVNKNLSAYGFTFNNTDTLQHECYVYGYEGLKESVTCEKFHASDDLRVTSTFSEQWKATARQFEKVLLADGWQKSQRDAQQPLEKIYDSTTEATVVYTKQHGKTECRFTLGLTAFPYGSTTFPQDKKKTYVVEECYRDIAFFGGY